MMPAAVLAAARGAPVALRSATVVALAGDRLVLVCEGVRATARLASSCPLAPSVGDEVLAWATKLGGRYMGEDRAEAFGRRNAVPGELLVRIHPSRTIGEKDVAD